LITLWSAYHTT